MKQKASPEEDICSKKLLRRGHVKGFRVLCGRLLARFCWGPSGPFLFKDAPPFPFEGFWVYSQGFWESILKASGFYSKASG